MGSIRMIDVSNGAEKSRDETLELFACTHCLIFAQPLDEVGNLAVTPGAYCNE